MSGNQAHQWANSSAGIAYALDKIKQVAGGLSGKEAIANIASRFERPADIPGEIAKASSRYGEFSGGTLPAAGGAPSGAPSAPGLLGGGVDAFKSLAAAQLLDQSRRTLAGEGPDTAGLMGLAIARRALGAAAMQFGPEPQADQPVVQPAKGEIQFGGASLAGTDPQFLSKLTAAAQAAGATRVRINSAKREAAHNAAVGGVSHSNHITGHAVDGDGFVPGRGWVPLGTLLLESAGKFGLRSGDVPGFFNGGRDPVHVDDAFNQR